MKRNNSVTQTNPLLLMLTDSRDANGLGLSLSVSLTLSPKRKKERDKDRESTFIHQNRRGGFTENAELHSYKDQANRMKNTNGTSLIRFKFTWIYKELPAGKAFSLD